MVCMPSNSPINVSAEAHPSLIHPSLPPANDRRAPAADDPVDPNAPNNEDSVETVLDTAVEDMDCTEACKVVLTAVWTSRKVVSRDVVGNALALDDKITTVPVNWSMRDDTDPLRIADDDVKILVAFSVRSNRFTCRSKTSEEDSCRWVVEDEALVDEAWRSRADIDRYRMALSQLLLLI